MFTALLVCTLSAGQSFKPPAEWIVEEVIGGTTTFGCYSLTNGNYGQACESTYPTKVNLKREFKLGAKVAAPTGCTISVEGKK